MPSFDVVFTQNFCTALARGDYIILHLPEDSSVPRTVTDEILTTCPAKNSERPYPENQQHPLSQTGNATNIKDTPPRRDSFLVSILLPLPRKSDALYSTRRATRQITSAERPSSATNPPSGKQIRLCISAVASMAVRTRPQGMPPFSVKVAPGAPYTCAARNPASVSGLGPSTYCAHDAASRIGSCGAVYSGTRAASVLLPNHDHI